MTDNEINVEIAKELGWEFHPECGPLYAPWFNRETKARASNEGLPNFTNDLNAMHKIEGEVYTKGILAETFVAQLQKIVPHRRTEGTSHLRSTNARLFELVNSTAHQRAEAFLRTLGKWKE